MVSLAALSVPSLAAPQGDVVETGPKQIVQLPIRTDGRTVATNGRAWRHLWLDVPEDAVVTSTFSLADRIAVLQEL